MSARSVLARACLKLYPRSWRDRYGDEVLLLAEESDGGIGDLVDLGLGALRQRAHQQHGGHPMKQRVNPWAASIAGVAAIVAAAPTALFIGLNLFAGPVEWLTGVRLPPDVGLTPGLEWLPALSLAALLIAIAPVVRMGVRRESSDGTSTLTLRILPLPRLLVAVIFACSVLVAAVIAYGISENLLGAIR